MADLKAASKALTQLLGTRANTLEWLSVAAKIAGAAGAAIIAASKIATIPPGIVYFAIAVVLFSALFVLFADKGSSTAIADAREAMDKALEQQAESENARRKYAAAEDAYEAELERLSHFQAARDVVRAIFEEVVQSGSAVDEVDVIDKILKQIKRQLFLSFGFKMQDYHTVCVYKRVVNSSGGAELVCKAHVRAIECDIKQARIWKEGIGASGVALASREEVVVPDLHAVELGSLYHIPEKKLEDDVRYRSIVAEPIAPGPSGLWGVLVVSSSVPGHFSVEDRTYVNVAQSFAGILGLAVKLVKANQGMPHASQAGGL